MSSTPSMRSPLRNSACASGGGSRLTLHRLDYLDATRGIAASLVVLHHAYQTAPFLPGLVRFSPLRILLTGRASVIFFFVLSGFVLAYGIGTSPRVQEPFAYACRRLVRIYIPYAVTGGLACWLYMVLRPEPLAGFGTTFNEMWTAETTARDMARHMMLFGTPQANSLNITAWSLVYELRISIFMPVLCALFLARPRTAITVTTLTYGVTEVLLALNGVGDAPYGAAGLFPGLVVTAHFSAFFIAGLLLAAAYIAQAPWMARPGTAARLLLWFAAASLVLVNRDTPIALGATAILYLCLTSSQLQHVLRFPVLLWLGRISFSLYLTHMLVLETIVRTTHDWLAPWISIPASILVALAFAWIFLIVVERPAHALSKAVGSVTLFRPRSKIRSLATANLDRPLPIASLQGPGA